MSEEGVEDVVEGLLRQSTTAAAQLGEQLARARQQFMRRAQERSEQQNIEAQRTMAADRAAMRAVVSPASQDEWWNNAKPEQITHAHLLAEAWKDHDPEALAVSEKITAEVKERYGIDTADLQGDGAYLQDRLAVQQMAEQHQRVAKEHAEAMALVAAVQAEEIKRLAVELHEQMERHQVPQDYLANDELVTALRESRDTAGADAAPDAERAVAERMHLIEKDGIEGPSIEDLRQEIGQNYPGVEDSHFADAQFVAAARDWHEAKTLAEGGFEAKGNTGLQGRYENAEKEFFARLAPMGKDIEDKVFNKSGIPAGAAESAGQVYGSAQHLQDFGNSLEGSASEQDVNGRLVAARNQARPAREAVKVPAKAPKARKASSATGAARDKVQDGPAR